MSGVKRLAGAALGALLLAGPAQAAQKASPSPEARTTARFEAATRNRAELRLFLRAMPKGGDLHNHLVGAAYAEDFLAWADADGLCVTTGSLPAIAAGPCDAPGKVPAKDLGKTNPALYGRAINALSMRNYHPGADAAAPSGHDQFFATFDRFETVTGGNLPGLLAVARDQAAGDAVGYVETSVNPSAMADLVALARNTPGTATWPRPWPPCSPASRP